MKTKNLIFILTWLSSIASNVNAQYEKRVNPNDYQIPVMKAIAYGITAPSPHNTQSWFIDTLSSTEMLLYVKQVLPETDPPSRQIHMGAGCFIECVAIGMSFEGYETEVEYFPQGEYTLKPFEMATKPVAKITLVKSTNLKKDVLYDYIYKRGTNRKPYKGKMIANEEFLQIKNLMGKTHSELILINEPNAMAPYLEIFRQGMEIETKTRLTNEETRRMFRFSESERQEKKTGLVCLKWVMME